MRIRPYLQFGLLTTAVVLSGCVSTWDTKVGPQTATKHRVTADLPAGWARFNREPDLVMTRDGLLLQSIRVSREEYGTKLPHTELVVAQRAEPHEAAQILIDAMSADQNRQHLEVIDNRPATVAGRAGFRLEILYRTAEGLTIRETLYVALAEDSYVVARYTAPERFYHERDRNAFERVVESLKIEVPVKRA